MSKQRPRSLKTPPRSVGDPLPPPTRPMKVGKGALGSTGRTPTLKRATTFGQLPYIYRAAFEETPDEAGPGPPPPGFLQAFNSKVEWIVYFWLWWLLKCEGDVRKPPFIGGRGQGGQFTYQINFFGGRRQPGGTVPDFAVLRPTRALILRLQGEWQHVFVHQVKIERDLFLKGRLTGENFEVIDIYEQHILNDPYSPAGTVPRVLQDALEGISWVGPIAAGNPYRTRLPFS